MLWRNDPAVDYPVGRVPIGRSPRKKCEDCVQRPRMKGYAVCRICARRREQESGR